MNNAIYLSRLSFEMLIRSQTDRPVFLPTGAAIEKSEAGDRIYGLRELTECGILVPDAKETGFDISEPMLEFIECVLFPEFILRTVGCETDASVFYYLSSLGAAVVEQSENRLDKFRLSFISKDDLVESVLVNMDLPFTREQEKSVLASQEDIDWQEELKELLKLDIADDTAEAVFRSGSVTGLIDVIKPEDFEVKMRMLICQPMLSIYSVIQVPGCEPRIHSYFDMAIAEELKKIEEATEC